jgi:hypothetical protein
VADKSENATQEALLLEGADMQGLVFLLLLMLLLLLADATGSF